MTPIKKEKENERFERMHSAFRILDEISDIVEGTSVPYRLLKSVNSFMNEQREFKAYKCNKCGHVAYLRRFFDIRDYRFCNCY